MADKKQVEDQSFIEVLESGIRKVLKSRKSTSAERVSAINAGAKLLIVKHKITGGDDDNFFGK